ncbi:MAG: DHH family phosphoesterase [Tissierella sp.]|uniref:DHH family phosphoesterase n=1 Tax=Tissierella sp. TaxID=41274 RepID=UPI003F9B753A
MNRNLDENIKNIIDSIKKSKNVFLASHINPDGDNLGSMLGLAIAIKNIGKNVFVLKSDIIPNDFTFLPGIDLIKEYDDNLGNIDLFITLDCSDKERLGDNKKLIENSNRVANIDHHLSNTNFGDINIVDPAASATAEIVYYIIKDMEIELTQDIALNLYTAINTDTGSFKYDNVTSKTHRIVADLLDTGFDKNLVNINLYESMSFTRMKLFIKSLTTLETFNNSKIAVIMVTQDMLKETGATLEDAEGIVSFIKKLSTVEGACLLKEIEKNNIKISLRTKKYLDASEICGKFDGGGHKRAAGCTIYKTIEESKKMIVQSIYEAMQV